MVQPWWGNFLQEVALPHVEIFNVLVPWGEFLVGIALNIWNPYEFFGLNGYDDEFRLSTFRYY